MAIQTIKATMQMRYGLEEDLEPDQLTTGEWAVSTNTKYVRMCFRPGLVLRMATYEAFEQDMVEIQTILATCRDIQAAVERFEQLAEQHKNDAASSALLSESWAHGETGIREGESEDNSKYWSEQSKSEADRAREEADRAETIAGLEIDSSLSETSINPVQNRVVTEELHKKLNKDSVVNDLLTTLAGVGVLDAHQGKVLKDLYDTLNRNVTKLNKNIILGGSKSFTVTEAGAWYRLGYIKKNSNFYGEFLITHNWGNSAPIYTKLLVAGGCNSNLSFYAKEVIQTFNGCGSSSPNTKNKMIKKARVVSRPEGTSAYNIYVDVFIQDTSEYIQKSNNWIYKLSTELYPFGFEWIDCAFGDATIPSGLVVQEFSFT